MHPLINLFNHRVWRPFAASSSSHSSGERQGGRERHWLRVLSGRLAFIRPTSKPLSLVSFTRSLLVALSFLPPAGCRLHKRVVISNSITTLSPSLRNQPYFDHIPYPDSRCLRADGHEAGRKERTRASQAALPAQDHPQLEDQPGCSLMFYLNLPRPNLLLQPLRASVAAILNSPNYL